MSLRDYSYYEAHVADVTLGDITSSDINKQILQWLRDGDNMFNDTQLINLDLAPGYSTNYRYFAVREGDDLGWLGYFIGKSKHLRELGIIGSPEDEVEEQRIIHALCDGIARNQYIQQVGLSRLSNDGFATIARILGDLTQLEELHVWRCVDNDNTLVTLLESGVILKRLWLHDAGLDGLRSIESSLEGLVLSMCNLGNDGLLTLATALTDCTSMKKLSLCEDDFSMAAAGLRSLSGWLQRARIQLDELFVCDCHINNEGLQALTEGAVNHCKSLFLERNNQITAAGLRLLSTSLQSERCCLENLNLGYTSIGDDGAEAFARGLVGNKTLRNLRLIGWGEDISITATGWSALSKVLCDTSSVNITYLSNHTIRELWEDYCPAPEDIPRNLAQYLLLNKTYPQHAARCKILMSHAHLDMKPLLKWELNCLPLVIAWFERAKPCLALSIGDNPILEESDDVFQSPILEESDEVFQSRVLTALYEFVRGAPKKVLERRGELTLAAAYDDKIAMVELEKKRLREEVEKLNEENMRLRGILGSVRKTVNHF